MNATQRAAAIRRATPDVLAELWEMQNRRCDLCGHPIQDLIVAALDHSVPVIYFARSTMPLAKAIAQANAPSNLRAAHASCNTDKGNRTREQWYALKLNLREEPRLLTDGELLAAQFKKGAGGRVSGRKHKENGTGVCAVGMAAKGGRKILERSVGIFAAGYDKSKGGRVAGRKTFENGTGIFAPEHRSKYARIGARRRNELHGNPIRGVPVAVRRLDSRIATHSRWHVARGIVNPKCELCRKEQAVA